MVPGASVQRTGDVVCLSAPTSRDVDNRVVHVTVEPAVHMYVRHPDDTDNSVAQSLYRAMHPPRWLLAMPQSLYRAMHPSILCHTNINTLVTSESHNEAVRSRLNWARHVTRMEGERMRLGWRVKGEEEDRDCDGRTA